MAKEKAPREPRKKHKKEEKLKNKLEKIMTGSMDELAATNYAVNFEVGAGRLVVLKSPVEIIQHDVAPADMPLGERVDKKIQDAFGEEELVAIAYNSWLFLTKAGFGASLHRKTVNEREVKPPFDLVSHMSGLESVSQDSPYAARMQKDADRRKFLSGFGVNAITGEVREFSRLLNREDLDLNGCVNGRFRVEELSLIEEASEKSRFDNSGKIEQTIYLAKAAKGFLEK